jgi:hypothetical protein
MQTYTTTAKDLRTFARAVKKWQKKMNLERWSIFVDHKDDDEDPEGDVAWIVPDYESLVARVVLSVTWPIEPAKELLDLAAFHECVHLALAPLMQHTKNDKLAKQEEHRLIVLLERLILGTSIPECGVHDGES